MSDETVTLKNGTKELKALVDVVVLKLNDLLKDGFDMGGLCQLYDLVMICENSTYQAPQENIEALQECHLLQPNGKPTSVVKNVVLSAITGEGTEMVLSSPYEEEK